MSEGETREGRQGRQGVQGTQGVQGLQGVQGEGPPGETGPQGERGKPGTPFRNRRVTGSFVLLTLIFVAVAGSQWYTLHELRHDRQVNRQRFADADLALCRGVESLKSARRAEANKSYRDLDQTLRLLRIEKTPEIAQLALDTRDRTLKRFAAIPCGSLPSAKGAS